MRNTSKDDKDSIIGLGLYTAMAEHILSDAIEIQSLSKAFKGNWEPFSKEFGCFGRRFHNAYLNINQYGELLVKPACSDEQNAWQFHRDKKKSLALKPDDPDFKNYFFRLLKLLVMGYKYEFEAKQMTNPDKNGKNILEACDVYIKHFGGEELTNEEMKWIGHPMNPFETVGFDELLEEAQHGYKNVGGKLRAHMKRVQKA